MNGYSTHSWWHHCNLFCHHCQVWILSFAVIQSIYDDKKKSTLYLLCRRRRRLVRKSPNCHKQLNFHSFLFHVAIFFLFHNIWHLFLASDQVLVPVAPPRPLSSLHLELRHLMDTFSHNAQLCGPYPEGFFEALPRKQREYLVRVAVRLVLPVNLCEICGLRTNQCFENNLKEESIPVGYVSSACQP